MDKEVKRLIKLGEYEKAIELLNGKESLEVIQRYYDKKIREFDPSLQPSKSLYEMFMELDPDDKPKPLYKGNNWKIDSKKFAKNILECVEGDFDSEIQQFNDGNVHLYIDADYLDIVNVKKFAKNLECAKLVSFYPQKDIWMRIEFKIEK